MTVRPLSPPLKLHEFKNIVSILVFVVVAFHTLQIVVKMKRDRNSIFAN